MYPPPSQELRGAACGGRDGSRGALDWPHLRMLHVQNSHRVQEDDAGLSACTVL
jgi:hypothetical protein